jgi:hypothetical protein
VDQREVNLRSKLRRDHEYGRGAWGGPSHYFNCKRDDFSQASCPNPSFCYNCKKDGHKSMACLAKKGLNLKICGHGKPGRLSIVSMCLKRMRRIVHQKPSLEFSLLKRG